MQDKCNLKYAEFGYSWKDYKWLTNKDCKLNDIYVARWFSNMLSVLESQTDPKSHILASITQTRFPPFSLDMNFVIVECIEEAQIHILSILH